MPIIIIVIIILFLVLIGWTWSNLGNIEKNKKIAYIIISQIIVFIITIIIFNISKSGVNYKVQEMIMHVQTVLVSVFTALNGFIVIQYIAKILGQKESGIIDNEVAKKRFIIIAVIFLICLIIECNYMKNIQIGMLNMYNLNK